MLRDAGFPSFLYCFFLSFFPFPLLALHLQVPTLSGQNDGFVDVNWDKDDGDPQTFFLQLNCHGLPPFRVSGPVPVLNPPKKYFLGDPILSQEEKHPDECSICAFQDPELKKKIICSKSFTSIAIA
ncbi:hypothetical protein BDZ94DRAFT_1255969 [Collybia nuda]|uniref:Uncharacterized protein n=1 Tax=Collybia nuda TaxID=64659 RepID=A0A9P6CFV0_9AGAR|nr:hypothetical protein BDZ94DRAFT_1255969 [Collybia nuda]